jgi:hypothetical protein
MKTTITLTILIIGLSSYAQTTQTTPNAVDATNTTYHLPAGAADLIIPVTKDCKEGTVTFAEPTLFIEITQLTTRDFVKYETVEVRPEELLLNPGTRWVPDLAGNTRLNCGIRAVDGGNEWLLFCIDSRKTIFPDRFGLRVYHLSKKHAWDSFTLKYRTVFFHPDHQLDVSANRSVKIYISEEPFLETVLKARGKNGN